MNKLHERLLVRGRELETDIWRVGFYDPAGNPKYPDSPDIDNAMLHMINDGLDEYQVSFKTIGLCTGIRDKNGALIFEGDIISTPYGAHHYIVKWDASSARFLGFAINKEAGICYVGMVDKNSKSAVEVIGNIHDNPELLETQS